jgi:hypothetical protein
VVRTLVCTWKRRPCFWFDRFHSLVKLSPFHTSTPYHHHRIVFLSEPPLSSSSPVAQASFHGGVLWCVCDARASWRCPARLSPCLPPPFKRAHTAHTHCLRSQPLLPPPSLTQDTTTQGKQRSNASKGFKAVPLFRPSLLSSTPTKRTTRRHTHLY